MQTIAPLLLCLLISALVEVHSQTVSVNSVTIDSTSLAISWSLADGAAVTGYSISYSNTDTQCFTDSDTVSGVAAGETSHTLTDLEEATEYTITVTALLTGGGSDEDSVTATTPAAGEPLLSSLNFINSVVSNHPASAPPTSVSTSDMTPSSITVQWGTMDCIHHNGDITGYSVRYGVQGSGITQIESVSGDATTEATISGLAAGTNYHIEVAAVNSAGTGVYSDPLSAITLMAGSNHGLS